MDAANIDLKAFTEEFYARHCAGQLAPVLETLKILKEVGIWFELVVLIIPTLNDSPDEIRQMSKWVIQHLGPDVPMHFTAFHPDFKMLDVPATPAATLVRARRIALDHGLRYVYTGNVHDTEGDATLCPGCGQVVIQRDWYRLLEWRLENGHCAACGAKIAGRFENKPGDWGARRVPVRIV